MSARLYDEDFYAWANEQARLLRAGKLSEVDIEHVAEEIESMGKGEKRELASRLNILLLHLLKWQYQPGRRGFSWRNSIRIQRREVASHMKDNASLKALLGAVIEQSYGTTVIEAGTQTGLYESTFPETCPWSFEQIMDANSWPGDVSAGGL